MNTQNTPDPLEDFITAVDVVCEQQYDLEDGGDLCFNLIEVGRIQLSMSVDEAAAIVAQHMHQA